MKLWEDITKFAEAIVPPVERENSEWFVDFVAACLAPLDKWHEDNYEALHAFVQKQKNRNANRLYMQKYLDDTFGVTGFQVVHDDRYRRENFLYWEQESQPDQFLYWEKIGGIDGEAVTKPNKYLYWEMEGREFPDFQVYPPVEFTGTETDVRAVVDSLRIYGSKYVVIYAE